MEQSIPREDSRGIGQTILWLGENNPTPSEQEVLDLVIGPRAVLEINPIQGPIRQHFLDSIGAPQEGLFPVLPYQEGRFRPLFPTFIDLLCGGRTACNFLVSRRDWPIEFFLVDGLIPNICLRWNEPAVLVEERVTTEGGRRVCSREIVRRLRPHCFLTNYPDDPSDDL